MHGLGGIVAELGAWKEAQKAKLRQQLQQKGLEKYLEKKERKVRRERL
jgi:hypothetical protein